MLKDIGYIEILKSLSIILLLALPPWIGFRRYLRPRLHEALLVFMFIGYIGITIFTQNFMPFVLVLFIFYFMRKYREDNQEMYYFRPLKGKWLEVVLFALVFDFLVRILNIIYAALLMKLSHVQLQTQEITSMFQQGGWLTILLLTVMTVLIAPILEEYIFRHILYRKMAGKLGKIAAALISSLLFTLLHYNLAGAISFFAVGLYNCYLYEKYGYRASVINHFIFNLSSTAMIVLLKLLNVNISS